MLKMDSTDEGTPLSFSSKLFMSSLDIGWIPDNCVDFFTYFVKSLTEKWMDLFALADEHLAMAVSLRGNHLPRDGLFACERIYADVSQRTRVQKFKGMEPHLINDLLHDSQKWIYLQDRLREHITAAQCFLTTCNENTFIIHEAPAHGERVGPALDESTILRPLVTSIEELGLGFKRLEQLRKESKELIELEFNLSSIYEAHRSTDVAASMRLLSWITVNMQTPL